MEENKNATNNAEVKSEAYVEIDKNMIIAETIGKPDVKLYDVREKPFSIYGFYEPYEQGLFKRLPKEVADATNPGVSRGTYSTAAGRVRFATDSSYVAIKAEMPVVGRNSHTPLEASAGFDLYEDYDGFGESRFVKAFLPKYTLDGGYEQVIDLGERKMRYFTINFPIHSRVRNLYVGIEENATLSEGLKYRNKRPIVVYGSSIVHGTGATRPGYVYCNMLTRRLNMNVINIGFSGNAKGEDAIVDYMKELDMCIFICDYDHNAPDPEHLRNTHLRMYQRFREVKPDTPYIIISRPNIATNRASQPYERRDVIYDTLRYAKEHGDDRIWYIDGESFFLGANENDCTIDTVHPNDMGYSLMVDGIEATIRKIMMDIDCLN